MTSLGRSNSSSLKTTGWEAMSIQSILANSYYLKLRDNDCVDRPLGFRFNNHV